MNQKELDQTQVEDIVKALVALSCKIAELEVQFQSKEVPHLNRYRDRVMALTRGLNQSIKSKLDPAMGVDFQAKADRSMDRLRSGSWFEVEDKIKGYHRSLSRNVR